MQGANLRRKFPGHCPWADLRLPAAAKTQNRNTKIQASGVKFPAVAHGLICGCSAAAKTQNRNTKTQASGVMSLVPGGLVPDRSSNPDGGGSAAWLLI